MGGKTSPWCNCILIFTLCFDNVSGALLSHFLSEPIYLSSVTVASDLATIESCRSEQDITDRTSAIWTDSEQGFGAPDWTQKNRLLMTSTTLELKDFTSDALTRAIHSRLVSLGTMLSLPYKLNVVSNYSHCVRTYLFSHQSPFFPPSINAGQQYFQCTVFWVCTELWLCLSVCLNAA